VEKFRYCPNCRAEYRAGFERCADCDIALVDELPTEPPPAEPAPTHLVPDKELVEVFRSNQSDARIVRGFLEAQGIPAILLGEGEMPYPIDIGSLGERRVYVREEDVEDARTAIAGAQADWAATHPHP
jgi:hypothetical protein